MKRKIIAAFMAAFLMTALWQPIAVQASPFFDFNKDFIVQAGYHDNLMFIQHSPGEVSAEDILWMIDNDCLDVAGAQWCVDAGLIPADAMSRPALQEPKTKPQSVYEDSTPSSGQNQPQQTPPPAAEKPVVQPTVQEAPQEEQENSSDNDAGQDAQQPGQAEGQSGQEEKTGGTTAESAQDGDEDQESTQAAGEEQAGGTEGGQEGESTAVDPSDDLFETAPAEQLSYSHFHDQLDDEAAAAYSYFLGSGSNCFIQVLNNSPEKKIRGKFLEEINGRADSEGEIRFATNDGQVLYSFVFRSPAVKDEDVLDLSLDLNKVPKTAQTTEAYTLTLGGTYPEGVFAKVMVDRINQKYSLYKGETKLGDYTSDFTGYLEVPVTDSEYTISCDLFMGEEQETATGQESTEAAEETPEGDTETESSKVPVMIAGVIVGIAVLAGLFVFIKKKKGWKA